MKIYKSILIIFFTLSIIPLFIFIFVPTKYIVKYENGKVKQVYYTKKYSEDPNGIVINYDSIGNLRRKFYYKNGILEGADSIYYENGDIKESMNWENGKLNGYSKVFYKGNILKSTVLIKEGSALDTLTIYHKNGKIREIQPYTKGGKLEGAVRTYRDNGSLEYLTKFDNDSLNFSFKLEKHKYTFEYIVDTINYEYILEVDFEYHDIKENTIALKDSVGKLYQLTIISKQDYKNIIQLLTGAEYTLVDRSVGGNENEDILKFIKKSNNQIVYYHFDILDKKVISIAHITNEDMSILEFSTRLVIASKNATQHNV